MRVRFGMQMQTRQRSAAKLIVCCNLSMSCSVRGQAMAEVGSTRGQAAHIQQCLCGGGGRRLAARQVLSRRPQRGSALGVHPWRGTCDALDQVAQPPHL